LPPRALPQPLDTFTVSLQRRRRAALGVALDRNLRIVPEHLGGIEGCLRRIPRRRAAQAPPERVRAMRLDAPRASRLDRSARRRNGKSDTLDAEAAARAVLARPARSEPKSATR